MARSLVRRLLAALLVVAASVPAEAQSTRYDPRLRFETLTTPSFSVHFHQREEPLARRVAAIAEEVAAQLSPGLGRPRRRVHVILVDQTDAANGWATVIPYNVIELTAAPPPAHQFIGNTNDWLRLVFTHEYTHVLHLEKSGGWLGSLRHVFGRLPLFYPNLALPDWQIEGMATHEESAVTGRGRLPAGDFRMVLDHAAAAGRFPSLDRAIGGIVDWPGGHSPYLFGGFFHEYLARTYGRDSLARLAGETSRRLPLFGSPAFRRVYGRSLGRLWQDFAADAARRATGSTGPALAAGRTRLTHHGFTVTSPLFTRDGRLLYSMSTPHGFPALMELRQGGRPREIATRYRGSRLAKGRDLLVFDQLEVVNQVDVQSDVYARPLGGGETRRLTRHARAADPDVSPDGETVVCAVQETGRRILATFTIPQPGHLASPLPLVSEEATEFSSPRWSPDGRFIAAERQPRGGPSEIVIVDAETRTMRTIVSSQPARNTIPVWLRDGATILFSSDRDGAAFTLYAVDVASGAMRRAPGAGDGAQAPTFSPDGTRMVFVGYSADGYDLYSIPLDIATWDVVSDLPRAVDPRAAPVPAPAAGRVLRPGSYRPWPTLAPRFWLPVIEADGDDVFVGASTAGSDALGRHSYSGTLGWSLDGRRADGGASYTYTRWWPALFAAVSTDTDFGRLGDVRSVEFTAGAVLPIRRVRWNSTTMAALFRARHSFDCTACEAPVDADAERSAVRLGWRISNAKSFGYSISAEQGSSLAVASELTRRSLGAQADAGTVTADVRHYFRAFPRHGVIAARLAAASAWGDSRLRRVFGAGGSGPQPGGFAFDVDAVGLLRGFDGADLVGDHAAVINVDYRFPLAWVQRGLGTLPFFLRSLHGAVFADAGHAWDDRFRAAAVARSAGAELSADTVLGSSLGLTVTAGAAWRHDANRRRRGVAAFARIGRAF